MVGPSPLWCQQLFIVMLLLLASAAPMVLILDFTCTVLFRVEVDRWLLGEHVCSLRPLSNDCKISGG